jgi:hypothetical protein
VVHSNIATRRQETIPPGGADLLIPLCGSYTPHNTWTEAEKAECRYFQEKRHA